MQFVSQNTPISLHNKLGRSTPKTSTTGNTAIQSLAGSQKAILWSSGKLFYLGMCNLSQKLVNKGTSNHSSAWSSSVYGSQCNQIV